MKSIQKIIPMIFMALTFSAVTIGMEGKQNESTVTPVISTFRTFIGKVADEQYGIDFQPKDSRRVLKAEDKETGNLMIGLFPDNTKSSEALAFIRKISEGSEEYPITFEDIDQKHQAFVNDIFNNRFLLASFILPSSQEEQTELTIPQGALQNDPAHFEVLLKRLEGFVQKARDDVQVQAKRLEGFVKN